MATLKERLLELERKSAKVLHTLILFTFDNITTPEQQTQITQAEKEGREVRIISFHVVD